MRKPLVEERVKALEMVIRADPKLREQYDRALQILINANDGTSTSHLVDKSKQST